MDYTFKQLVQQAKKGDDKAAEKLLKALRPLLLANINKYASKTEDREELLQEGYLELLRLIHDYDERRGVPFLGYVKKKLKFFYINFVSRQRVVYDSLDREVDIGNEKVPLLSLIPDAGLPVPEKYEKKELNAALAGALGKLTPRQKEVIILHYYYNMPMIKIAKKQGNHYMSVVKIKKRALKELNRRLGHQIGFLY
ncbi:MAG: sigma-70 family RNA polymerase sigma factor [Clostridiaceae bacterium]|nr:sigma-70 family RNA polymerase sigma factor [Clostridiaceae bacterium]